MAAPVMVMAPTRLLRATTSTALVRRPEPVADMEVAGKKHPSEEALLPAGITRRAALLYRFAAATGLAAGFRIAAGKRSRLAARLGIAALRCRFAALRLTTAVAMRKVKQSSVSALGTNATDQQCDTGSQPFHF